jgi:DNA polymerase-1
MGSQESSVPFNHVIFYYRKEPDEFLPCERIFKVPNVDKVIEDGKKTPTKFRNIRLHRILDTPLPTDIFTASGWPSVSGDALKTLAGKVSAEYDFMDDASNQQLDDNVENASEIEVSVEKKSTGDVDNSAYGKAFDAFKEEEKGREACHAIAALCEVCSIDSLISNFILPLQVIASNMSFWYGQSLINFVASVVIAGCIMMVVKDLMVQISNEL